jgi:hypothetical protein
MGFPNNLLTLGYFGIVVEFVLKAYPTQGPFSTGTFKLVYPTNELVNVFNTFHVSGMTVGPFMSDIICSR